MEGEGKKGRRTKGEGKGGIYVRERSGEGRCAGAFPDRGGAKPGRANTDKIITIKI